MSLSAVLDRISKEHAIKPAQRQFFDEESLNNWPSKAGDYSSQFKATENNEEKEKWLKDLFIELFELFQKPELPAKLTLQQISSFIDDISSSTGIISSQELCSLVGKMFIAVSNQFADGDDSKVIALARINNLLSKEIYKFSRVSSKLMTSEQTILLRHLLKRSKYELKKFNLLAECPSGYSQLVMLLSSAFNDLDNTQKVAFYAKQMSHIIGKYSLDSMRSLDIILDVSSEYITDHYTFFIQLLKNSDFWPKNNEADSISLEGLNHGGSMVASNVISFRISQKGPKIDMKYLDMVCILIKNGFVNVLSIWQNIGPDCKSLGEFFKKFENELEEESMKGVANPLAMAAALSFDEDDRDTNIQKHSEDKESKIKGRNESDAKMERRETQSSEIDDILQSGKLQLLQRLLVHGCLTASFYLLRRHPTFVHIDDSIPLAVVRAFEYITELIYHSTVFSPQEVLQSSRLVTLNENGILSHKPRLIEERKTHHPSAPFELGTRAVFYYPEWTSELSLVNSVEDLIKTSHEYFSIIGVRLAVCPKLISKLCRIAKSDISGGNGSTETWVDYVRKFIFPSIASLDLNPTVTNEIYGLMKLFPFERRYFMYNEMITKLSQDILPIKVGFNKTEREAKSMLKALSIDSIDEQSRRLANLVSTNPLATLIPAVKQIENYDKVSELVVTTACFFNDFAYDVLQFVLLLRLTDNRIAVQEDGVNQSMWVQRLSVFIAGLAKSCGKMDLSNIIEYIVKTLHSGNIIAVSILRQLVVTVGGIRDLNEVNTKQLLMLNSGKPLQNVARRLMFDFRDDNRLLGSRLVEYFGKEKSISEVIILLFNLNLKANSHEAHYKILSVRCDEMNTLLWSFIELIKHSLDGERFFENVLPLNLLTNDHKVSTPWVFHIWREYIDTHGEDDRVNDMIEKAKFEEVDFSYISRDLFITFWKLSLYDIQFNKALYDERKVTLEAELASYSSTKKKNEVSNQVKDLLVSCISHQKKFNQSKHMLQQQSTSWTHSMTEVTIKSFFQYCAIPRVLFSPPDAIYVSSFLLLTFDIESLMTIVANFIRSEVLSTLLFCCTSSEAGNLGIFFAHLLEQMEIMRKSDQLNQQCCRELYGWHEVITEQVVLTLSNKNYMSIRNGIEFMKHLSHVFPVLDTQINLVCETVSENLEGEEREDIKLPSNALLGHLKARLKNAIALKDFCELTAEELEEKAKFEAELEEIRLYEAQLANEKKEAELRKKLELNKKQRENAQKTREHAETAAYAPPTGPSAQVNSWPFGKVIRFIDEVCNNFRRNNLNRAVNCIIDQQERENMRDLMKQAMPLRDFKSSVLAIFERFFLSLVNNRRNPELTRKLEDLQESVEFITRDAAKKRSDMYSDAPEHQEVKKYSRYSGSVKREAQITSPAASASRTTDDSKASRTSANNPRAGSRQSGRISGKNEATPESISFKSKAGNDSRPTYSNRQKRNAQFDNDSRPRGPKAEEARRTPTPLAPRALLHSDRPPQRFQSRSQASEEHRAYDSAQASEERPLKRFRSGDKPNDNRQGTRAPDRSRFNDRKSQALPQGPKAAKEPQSRYQR